MHEESDNFIGGSWWLLHQKVFYSTGKKHKVHTGWNVNYWNQLINVSFIVVIYQYLPVISEVLWSKDHKVTNIKKYSEVLAIVVMVLLFPQMKAVVSTVVCSKWTPKGQKNKEINHVRDKEVFFRFSLQYENRVNCFKGTTDIDHVLDFARVQVLSHGSRTQLKQTMRTLIYKNISLFNLYCFHAKAICFRYLASTCQTFCWWNWSALIALL